MRKDDWKQILNENKRTLHESKKGALMNLVSDLIDDLEVYSNRIKNTDTHIKNLTALAKDINKASF